MQLDFEDIKKLIPQRFPFIMIDRVLEIEPGKHATAVKNISGNDMVFLGHFPDKAIMPGALILEAMAQTAAVLVVLTLGPDAEGKLVYFMTIDEARFRRPVAPGDTLHIHVTKLRHRRNVWKFSGQAKVNGTLVAEAEFAAMIMDD